MSFLRLIYNLLSILGAVVIGFIVFAALGSGWHRVTRGAPPAAPTREARQKALEPQSSLAALPVGRIDAKSRGMLVTDALELLALEGGEPVYRTRDAWIERHGPEEFLLVSPDFALRPRRDTSRHVAFRLPDGSAVKVYWVRLPEVGYVGFARFHSRPPERLVIVTVRSDSLINAGK